MKERKKKKVDYVVFRKRGILLATLDAVLDDGLRELVDDFEVLGPLSAG